MMKYERSNNETIRHFRNLCFPKNPATTGSIEDTPANRRDVEAIVKWLQIILEFKMLEKLTTIVSGSPLLDILDSAINGLYCYANISKMHILGRCKTYPIESVIE